MNLKRHLPEKILRLSIENTQDKFGSLLRTFFTALIAPASIIYCSSRRETEEVNQLLNSRRDQSDLFSRRIYLPNKSKTDCSPGSKNNILVMVATNAFGMGIDKGNVGLVVHLTIPASLEHLLSRNWPSGSKRRQTLKPLPISVLEMNNA